MSLVYQSGAGCFGGSCMQGGGVRNVYVGTPNQRGRGIGSWLGGLARQAYPILKKGLGNIAQESLHTGMNILGDVLKGQTPRSSAKRRVVDSTEKLKRKFNDYMEGLGKRKKRKRRKANRRKHKYITGKGKKKRQSSKGRKRRRTASKLKKKIAKKQKQKKHNLKRRKKSTKFNLDIFS